MARADQGTPRCHTPCAAHGIHVGGGNTDTAPIFAARAVWVAARRHDCAASATVAVDSYSQGGLGSDRRCALGIPEKRRLCRSRDGTCNLGRSTAWAASRLLGRSWRSSRTEHAEHPSNLHLLASAGRDLARFSRWRHGGGERWSAPGLVLDCTALCRLCFGLSLERRRLHGRPSGLYRVCRGALLYSYSLAKGGGHCSNRRYSYRWRDQPARGLARISWRR